MHSARSSTHPQDPSKPPSLPHQLSTESFASRACCKSSRFAKRMARSDVVVVKKIQTTHCRQKFPQENFLFPKDNQDKISYKQRRTSPLFFGLSTSSSNSRMFARYQNISPTYHQHIIKHRANFVVVFLDYQCTVQMSRNISRISFGTRARRRTSSTSREYHQHISVTREHSRDIRTY
jgi:hypothetical protein